MGDGSLLQILKGRGSRVLGRLRHTLLRASVVGVEKLISRLEERTVSRDSNNQLHRCHNSRITDKKLPCFREFPKPWNEDANVTGCRSISCG